jgi:4-hydroxyphenylpyruvate dioxygenase
MDISHIHFYVRDAGLWCCWFVQTLGFHAIARYVSYHTLTEVVQAGNIYFLLSSPLQPDSPVARYLQVHPPGVTDVMFRVRSLQSTLEKAIANGGKLLQPIQRRYEGRGYLQWAVIAGWGDLQHTLFEQRDTRLAIPLSANPSFHIRRVFSAHAYPLIRRKRTVLDLVFSAIDHVVLNVSSGDLQRAIDWYETVFGFQRRQTFCIQTERSGLISQVLMHPEGSAQLPVNEPVSVNSQIQEFLNINQGSGVQHIALRTPDILKSLSVLRSRGLSFLQIPPTYYEQLQNRSGFWLKEADWKAIAEQEVLVDWQPDLPEALLLQTFTQPIFEQPTFFFELIQRQTYYANCQHQEAQGFGEGNFRALFEAIEQEQIKRGSLS